MKILTVLFFLFCGAYYTASAHTKSEFLLKEYEQEGDKSFQFFYYYSETEAMVKAIIPNHDNTWFGYFDDDLWKKIKEERKLALLKEIGKKLEGFKPEKLADYKIQQKNWDTVAKEYNVISELFLHQSTFTDIEGYVNWICYTPGVMEAWPMLAKANQKKPNVKLGDSFSSSEKIGFSHLFFLQLTKMKKDERCTLYINLINRFNTQEK